MKILELFAGSCSFSKVAKERNHQTFTTDYKDFDNIDYVTDILDFDVNKVPFKPDVIWASPPCTTFSIASCSHHWTKDKEPKTDACIQGIKYVLKAIDIIEYFKPHYFFIENPRGLLRKMDFMQRLETNGYFRRTVTYCQYGDSRMKPTDIWTSAVLDVWKPRPMCKNGMPCHEAAPRGSRTGTQGLKNNYERSKVPEELCKEILDSVENSYILRQQRY